MLRVGKMRRMGWQANEEVNQNTTGKAYELNLQGGIDSKDEAMHF